MRSGLYVDDVNAAIHRLLRPGRLKLVGGHRWLILDESIFV
jgi:hypothetical protein